MGTNSNVVFLFVDIGDLSFVFVDKVEGCKMFDLEDLPLMVRGRINMLRLAKDYSYTEGLGYKGKISKTLELTVYVEDDELEQLRKLCPTILVYKLRPTILVYKLRDSHNEKAE